MKSAAGRSPQKPPREQKAQPQGNRRGSGSRRKAAVEPNRSVASSLGKIAIVLVLLGGVGIIALNAFRGQPKVEVAVVEPKSLSPLATAGKRLFEASCAACHGATANGTDHGPPFVSDIYNPGHHPDEAFILAAKYGVRAHHWRFGNMPPVQGIADADVAAIVRYVREVQEANGIVFRPHVM